MTDNIENNSDSVFPEFSLEDITSNKPKYNNLFKYLTEFNNSFINNDDDTSFKFITELYDIIHDKEFNELLEDKTQIDPIVNENQIIDNDLTHPLKSFIDEFIGQGKPIESMEVVKTRLPRTTADTTTENKLFIKFKDEDDKYEFYWDLIDDVNQITYNYNNILLTLAMSILCTKNLKDKVTEILPYVSFSEDVKQTNVLITVNIIKLFLHYSNINGFGETNNSIAKFIKSKLNKKTVYYDVIDDDIDTDPDNVVATSTNIFKRIINPYQTINKILDIEWGKDKSGATKFLKSTLFSKMDFNLDQILVVQGGLHSLGALNTMLAEYIQHEHDVNETNNVKSTIKNIEEKVSSLLKGMCTAPKLTTTDNKKNNKRELIKTTLETIIAIKKEENMSLYKDEIELNKLANEARNAINNELEKIQDEQKEISKLEREIEKMRNNNQNIHDLKIKEDKLDLLRKKAFLKIKIFKINDKTNEESQLKTIEEEIKKSNNGLTYYQIYKKVDNEYQNIFNGKDKNNTQVAYNYEKVESSYSTRYSSSIGPAAATIVLTTLTSMSLIASTVVGQGMVSLFTSANTSAGQSIGEESNWKGNGELSDAYKAGKADASASSSLSGAASVVSASDIIGGIYNAYYKMKDKVSEGFNITNKTLTTALKHQYYIKGQNLFYQRDLSNLTPIEMQLRDNYLGARLEYADTILNTIIVGIVKGAILVATVGLATFFVEAMFATATEDWDDNSVNSTIKNVALGVLGTLIKKFPNIIMFAPKYAMSQFKSGRDTLYQMNRLFNTKIYKQWLRIKTLFRKLVMRGKMNPNIQVIYSDKLSINELGKNIKNISVDEIIKYELEQIRHDKGIVDFIYPEYSGKEYNDKITETERELKPKKYFLKSYANKAKKRMKRMDLLEYGYPDVLEELFKEPLVFIDDKGCKNLDDIYNLINKCLSGYAKKICEGNVKCKNSKSASDKEITSHQKKINKIKEEITVLLYNAKETTWTKNRQGYEYQIPENYEKIADDIEKIKQIITNVNNKDVKNTHKKLIGSSSGKTGLIYLANQYAKLNAYGLDENINSNGFINNEKPKKYEYAKKIGYDYQKEITKLQQKTLEDLKISFSDFFKKIDEYFTIKTKLSRLEEEKNKVCEYEAEVEKINSKVKPDMELILNEINSEINSNDLNNPDFISKFDSNSDGVDILKSLMESIYVKNSLYNIVRHHRNNFLETLFLSFQINELNNEDIKLLINDKLDLIANRDKIVNIFGKIKIDFSPNIDERNIKNTNSILFVKIYESFEIVIQTMFFNKIVKLDKNPSKFDINTFNSQIKNTISSITKNITIHYVNNLLKHIFIDLCSEVRDKQMNTYPINFFKYDTKGTTPRVLPTDYDDSQTRFFDGERIHSNNNHRRQSNLLRADKLKDFFKSFTYYMYKLITFKPLQWNECYKNQIKRIYTTKQDSQLEFINGFKEFIVTKYNDLNTKLKEYMTKIEDQLIINETRLHDSEVVVLSTGSECDVYTTNKDGEKVKISVLADLDDIDNPENSNAPYYDRNLLTDYSQSREKTDFKKHKFVLNKPDVENILANEEKEKEENEEEEKQQDSSANEEKEEEENQQDSSANEGAQFITEEDREIFQNKKREQREHSLAKASPGPATISSDIFLDKIKRSIKTEPEAGDNKDKAKWEQEKTYMKEVLKLKDIVSQLKGFIDNIQIEIDVLKTKNSEESDIGNTIKTYILDEYFGIKPGEHKPFHDGDFLFKNDMVTFKKLKVSGRLALGNNMFELANKFKETDINYSENIPQIFEDMDNSFDFDNTEDNTEEYENCNADGAKIIVNISVINDMLKIHKHFNKLVKDNNSYKINIDGELENKSLIAEKRIISGIFGSANIFNEIDIFIDAYVSYSHLDIYSTKLYEYVIDKDELFNIIDYEYSVVRHDKLVNKTIKLRYFKYYEFRSINNFIADHFPIVTDIYEPKLADIGSTAYTEGLHTPEDLKYIPEKIAYRNTIENNSSQVLRSFCHTKMRNRQNKEHETVTITTCNLVNISIKEMRDIIMDTYIMFTSVLDNVVINESIIYKQLNDSFNSGLMYEYDTKTTLFYDFFSFSQTLKSVSAISNYDTNKSIKKLKNSHIIKYFMNMTYKNLLFDIEKLTKKIGKNLIKVNDLELITSKFTLKDIIVDLEHTKDERIKYPDFSIDNICNNGEELYANNQIHNIDRYETGNSAKPYNRMANRFNYRYNVSQDSINLSIRGSLDEYDNAISEIDTNIASFKLSFQKDIIGFMKNFVANNEHEFPTNKLIMTINNIELKIFDGMTKSQKIDLLYKLFNLELANNVKNMYNSISPNKLKFVSNNYLPLFRVKDVVKPVKIVKKNKDDEDVNVTMDDLDQDFNDEYGKFLFIFKFIIFDFITENTVLNHNTVNEQSTQSSGINKVDLNIPLNHMDLNEEWKILSQIRFFKDNILLTRLLRLDYVTKSNEETGHIAQIRFVPDEFSELLSSQDSETVDRERVLEAMKLTNEKNRNWWKGQINKNGLPLEKDLNKYILTNFGFNLTEFKTGKSYGSKTNKTVFERKGDLFNKLFEFIKFYNTELSYYQDENIRKWLDGYNNYGSNREEAGAQFISDIETLFCKKISNYCYQNITKKDDFNLDISKDSLGNINIDLDTNISIINTQNVLSIIDIYHSEISENLHFYTSVNKINADFIRILYDTLIMGKIYTDVNVTHELDYAQFTKLTGIDVKAFPEIGDDELLISRFIKAINLYRNMYHCKDDETEPIGINATGFSLGGSYSAILVYYVFFRFVKSSKYKKISDELQQVFRRLNVLTFAPTKEFSFLNNTVLNYFIMLFNRFKTDTLPNFGSCITNTLIDSDPQHKVPTLNFHLGNLLIMSSNSFSRYSSLIYNAEKYLLDKDMKNTTYASHYDIVDTLDKDNVNKNLYKLDIENIIKQYNIINGENSESFTDTHLLYAFIGIIVDYEDVYYRMIVNGENTSIRLTLKDSHRPAISYDFSLDNQKLDKLKTHVRNEKQYIHNNSAISNTYSALLGLIPVVNIAVEINQALREKSINANTEIVNKLIERPSGINDVYKLLSKNSYPISKFHNFIAQKYESSSEDPDENKSLKIDAKAGGLDLLLSLIINEYINNKNIIDILLELNKKDKLYVELSPYNNVNENTHYILNPLVSSQWKENSFINRNNLLLYNSNDIINNTIDLYLEKSFYINDITRNKDGMTEANVHSRFWHDYNAAANKNNDLRNSSIDRSMIRTVKLKKSNDNKDKFILTSSPHISYSHDLSFLPHTYSSISTYATFITNSYYNKKIVETIPKLISANLNVLGPTNNETLNYIKNEFKLLPLYKKINAGNSNKTDFTPYKGATAINMADIIKLISNNYMFIEGNRTFSKSLVIKNKKHFQRFEIVNKFYPINIMKLVNSMNFDRNNQNNLEYIIDNSFDLGGSRFNPLPILDYKNIERVCQYRAASKSNWFKETINTLYSEGVDMGMFADFESVFLYKYFNNHFGSKSSEFNIDNQLKELYKILKDSNDPEEKKSASNEIRKNLSDNPTNYYKYKAIYTSCSVTNQCDNLESVNHPLYKIEKTETFQSKAGEEVEEYNKTHKWKSMAKNVSTLGIRKLINTVEGFSTFYKSGTATFNLDRLAAYISQNRDTVSDSIEDEFKKFEIEIKTNIINSFYDYIFKKLYAVTVIRKPNDQEEIHKPIFRLEGTPDLNLTRKMLVEFYNKSSHIYSNQIEKVLKDVMEKLDKIDFYNIMTQTFDNYPCNINYLNINGNRIRLTNGTLSPHRFRLFKVSLTFKRMPRLQCIPTNNGEICFNDILNETYNYMYDQDTYNIIDDIKKSIDEEITNVEFSVRDFNYTDPARIGGKGFGQHKFGSLVGESFLGHKLHGEEGTQYMVNKLDNKLTNNVSEPHAKNTNWLMYFGRQGAQTANIHHRKGWVSLKNNKLINDFPPHNNISWVYEKEMEDESSAMRHNFIFDMILRLHNILSYSQVQVCDFGSEKLNMAPTNDIKDCNFLNIQKFLKEPNYRKIHNKIKQSFLELLNINPIGNISTNIEDYDLLEKTLASKYDISKDLITQIRGDGLTCTYINLDSIYYNTEDNHDTLMLMNDEFKQVIIEDGVIYNATGYELKEYDNHKMIYYGKKNPMSSYPERKWLEPKYSYKILRSDWGELGANKMTNDSETSNEDTNNLKRLYESGKVELWRTINYARISMNAGLDGYLFTHIRPTKKPVKQDILGLLIDGMTFIIPNNWILYKEKEKEDTYDAEEGQAHEEAISGNSDIEILFDEKTKLRYSYNKTTEETDWLDDKLAGEDTAVAAAEDDVEDTTPIDNRDKSKKNWKKISKAVVTDKELIKSWITIPSKGLYNRAFVSSSGKEFVEITKAELSSEDLVDKTIYKKAKDISSIVTLLKEQREHQGGSVTCCKKDCQYNREQGSFFCLNHSINSILDNKKQSHDFIFN